MKDRENIDNILDYLKNYCEKNNLDLAIMIGKDIKKFIIKKRDEKNENS